MKQLLFVSLALAACRVQEIPRPEWPQLGKYRPRSPALVETPGGMYYITPKTEVTFVPKDGREITRRWQEISLAKNVFTAISVNREVFQFPLAALSKVLAHGKPAGEITGVVPDTTRGPPPGQGPVGRPMF
jgi:hypothetical protein